MHFAVMRADDRFLSAWVVEETARKRKDQKRYYHHASDLVCLVYMSFPLGDTKSISSSTGEMSINYGRTGGKNNIGSKK